MKKKTGKKSNVVNVTININTLINSNAESYNTPIKITKEIISILGFFAKFTIPLFLNQHINEIIFIISYFKDYLVVLSLKLL